MAKVCRWGPSPNANLAGCSVLSSHGVECSTWSRHGQSGAPTATGVQMDKAMGDCHCMLQRFKDGKVGKLRMVEQDMSECINDILVELRTWTWRQQCSELEQRGGSKAEPVLCTLPPRAFDVDHFWVSTPASAPRERVSDKMCPGGVFFFLDTSALLGCVPALGRYFVSVSDYATG